MPAVSMSQSSGPIHYGFGYTSTDCSRINEDFLKSIETSRIENKIDFFRFMGLEIKKVCDTNYLANINNNDIGENGLTRSIAERPLTVTGETKVCDVVASGLNKESAAMDVGETINKSDTPGDTLNARNMIASIRQCSVTIVGEKCAVCGENFKCIKDLDIHARKKHKRKKPKMKLLLLKIGNEVISRVPIRRKHLKRIHKRENDLGPMPSTNEIGERSSWSETISPNSRIDEDSLVEPLIIFEDIANRRSNLPRNTERDVPSCTPRRSSNLSSNSFANDDDDIREIFAITRIPSLGTSINHDTPNPTKRELLLSEAIRELDRIANDHADGIASFANDAGTMNRKRNEVSDDFDWLANANSPDYEAAKNNCTYDIRNDWDSDLPLGLHTPLTAHLDPKYFDGENARNKRYCKGDYGIPDFIDYSECLNKRARFDKTNDNNNSIYGFDGAFCVKRRMERSNERGRRRNGDARNRNDAIIDLPIFIKEEIMLEDGL